MTRVVRIIVTALGTRWLVRAPIWLFRCRLGALFSSRLVMIEHQGRLSGRTRQVVLKVVERPSPDTFVLLSGFGTQAQWYRNVCASPHVLLYRA